VPRVHLARLRGMLFDTNKTFILPTALPSLQKIRTLYEQLDPAEVLVVGHTDTTGEPSVNDPLSKKRADAMAQYLTDDVDGWLANYESSVPQKERWGAREDRLMLLKLPGYDARPPEKPPIEWYQEQHNAAVDAGVKAGRPQLTVDGKAGPKTRRELITDYMALDGVTLSEDEEFHISVQTHGCGENFPLDESLTGTDERPAAERDGERDRHDRRVELFFFDHEFAVRPPPTSADGAEYLTWRKLARRQARARLRRRRRQQQGDGAAHHPRPLPHGQRGALAGGRGAGQRRGGSKHGGSKHGGSKHGGSKHGIERRGGVRRFDVVGVRAGDGAALQRGAARAHDAHRGPHGLGRWRSGQPEALRAARGARPRRAHGGPRQVRRDRPGDPQGQRLQADPQMGVR